MVRPARVTADFFVIRIAKEQPCSAHQQVSLSDSLASLNPRDHQFAQTPPRKIRWTNTPCGREANVERDGFDVTGGRRMNCPDCGRRYFQYPNRDVYEMES
jgi:hypothetical protein